MRYLSFEIENYRAIVEPLKIDLKNNSLIPLIGINECGKTTILQAILCFDYAGDYINSKQDGQVGPHLQHTLNLYSTNDGIPTITATLEISFSELESTYSSFSKENNIDPIQTPLPITKDNFSKDFNNIITISRNLKDLTYSIISPKILGDIDGFGKDLVSASPYILYNDDFNDRPPTEVLIPSKKPATLSGWLDIYEQLFNDTDKTFSLFSLIQETDQRRRDTILSRVQKHLNEKLTKAWKTFHLDSKQGALNLKLSLSDRPLGNGDYKLTINIIEDINGTENTFHITDRSKGFLWFFNFIMKIEFNPKVTGEKKDTIYLLDEPGSYLHASAQDKLCIKLKNISSKNGNIIFCTHSHHLLNPELIPLHKMYIIEKNAKKKISAIPFTQYKVKGEKMTALQPMYEALQMPMLNQISSMGTVLCVEGIYDYYALKMLSTCHNKCNIIPSVSADSMVKSIPFVIASGKKYILLWDNDKEGRNKRNEAIKTFGAELEPHFLLLPDIADQHTRMENFIEKEDLSIMRKALGLDEGVSYEKTIGTLFFSSDKESILKNITQKTKDNFTKINNLIENTCKIP